MLLSKGEQVEEHYQELNTLHISQMALVAAKRLEFGAAAWIDLQPGDMTRYEIVIVKPSFVCVGPDGGYESGDSIVTIANFGTTGRWSGAYVTPGWAADRWGGGSDHTGKVISLFLNELARILPANFFSTYQSFDYPQTVES